MSILEVMSPMGTGPNSRLSLLLFLNGVDAEEELATRSKLPGTMSTAASPSTHTCPGGTLIRVHLPFPATLATPGTHTLTVSPDNAMILFVNSNLGSNGDINVTMSPGRNLSRLYLTVRLSSTTSERALADEASE